MQLCERRHPSRQHVWLKPPVRRWFRGIRSYAGRQRHRCGLEIVVASGSILEVIDTKPKQDAVGAGEVARPLWTILAIAICLLVLRRLVHQSFFLDGAIYASIARNLSEGIGSPWKLQFSQTMFSVFSEHPPLMMWLEAIGFRLFGDTIAVEKGFTFLTLVASGFILLKIWQSLHANDPELRAGGPVALAMALVAGRVSWAFSNGMLENLLIVFTSLAIYGVVGAYGKAGARTSVSRTLVMIVSGLLVALALLTKGPVGLFPVATPAIYWIVFRRPGIWSVVVDSFVMVATVAAVFVVLWQFEGARDAITRYLSIQLFPSLTGQRGISRGHWSAVRTFFRVNAYPAVITLIILLCDKRWGQAPVLTRDVKLSRLRIATFLALVGFSASLPLLVSPLISSFYFNPSLAYFASAFAVACVPAIMRALRGSAARIRHIMSLGLLALLALSVVLVAFNFGRPGHDAATIADASKIAAQVCSSPNACEDKVAVCGAAARDWVLYTYLQRTYKISLTPIDARTGGYLIVDDSCAADIASYRDTDLSLLNYRLMKKLPM
ncbi:glycosyltransferase family 39 protein [Rhizobium sp. RHZ01]|uniref:ArnT family glycosyltransferase n=1 Tax=Rhizobium sp. RHZ01 TaxID=2769304 RepID=UPI0017871256|nr:glycosyltransferase family 39 protein [Rhizobium sp. RHZ01]MBD9443991.1 glycosyltransferase family 39 protein [Rhizobium sp. RHZ01]